MPKHDTIDLSGWMIVTSANGAFGYRAIVVGTDGISGTGKTEAAAIAAAQTKLRKRLAELEANGTPATPPRAAPPPASVSVGPLRLLELLAAADSNEPAPAKELRLKAERWRSERDETSAEVQNVLKHVLELDGFSKPLSHDNVKNNGEQGATGRAIAFTSGGDLKVVIACSYRLDRSSAFSVDHIAVALQRVSTGREAQRDVPLTTVDGNPAIDRDDVHAALTKLVHAVSFAYEPPAKQPKASARSGSRTSVRSDPLSESRAHLNSIGGSPKAAAPASPASTKKRRLR